MIIDHSSAPDFSDALPLPFCPFPALPDVDEPGDQDAGKRNAVKGRPPGAVPGGLNDASDNPKQPARDGER